MNIRENVSLKPYNTFGIEATAKTFAELNTFPDVQEFIDMMRNRDEPYLILGGGSNVLLTKDFDGVVVIINTKGIQKITETNDHILLKVQAGEVWDDFVNYCIENNYGGIENLALIPGSIGSCSIQNIGAYGVEVKETIQSVEVINLDNLQLQDMSNAECRFAYRDSAFKHEFKGKVIIISVLIRLTKTHSLHQDYGAIKDELKILGITEPDIKDIAAAVRNIRRSKLPDPKEIGNAGSFFKNPLISETDFNKLKLLFPAVPYYKQDEVNFKIPAGWLIEQCGWKGYREGDAGVHAKQALVLVNYGNAKGQDILDLANKIRQSVTEKFGIALEMEVNVI